MQNSQSLHNLTDNALNHLRSALEECRHAPTEALILSAMVKVRQIHDSLPEILDVAEVEFEEYCCPV